MTIKQKISLLVFLLCILLALEFVPMFLRQVPQQALGASPTLSSIATDPSTQFIDPQYLSPTTTPEISPVSSPEPGFGPESATTTTASAPRLLALAVPQTATAPALYDIAVNFSSINGNIQDVPGCDVNGQGAFRTFFDTFGGTDPNAGCTAHFSKLGTFAESGGQLHMNSNLAASQNGFLEHVLTYNNPLVNGNGNFNAGSDFRLDAYPSATGGTAYGVLYDDSNGAHPAFGMRIVTNQATNQTFLVVQNFITGASRSVVVDRTLHSTVSLYAQYDDTTKTVIPKYSFDSGATFFRWLNNDGSTFAIPFFTQSNQAKFETYAITVVPVFAPNPNGYSFANIGNSNPSLIAKRALFYDVFGTQLATQSVIDAWLNNNPTEFGVGGDCFGMIISAIREFTGPVHLLNNGQTIFSLSEPPIIFPIFLNVWNAGNVLTNPTLNRIVEGQLSENTLSAPIQIDMLFTSANIANPANFVLGIRDHKPFVNFIPQPPVRGHALLPYRVEPQVPGQSFYTVHVYDPDRPGDANRVVTFTKVFNVPNGWRREYLYQSGDDWVSSSDLDTFLVPVANYSYDANNKLQFAGGFYVNGAKISLLQSVAGQQSGYTPDSSFDDIPAVAMFMPLNATLSGTSTPTVQFRGNIDQNLHLQTVPFDPAGVTVLKWEQAGYVMARFTSPVGSSIFISADDSVITVASSTGPYTLEIDKVTNGHDNIFTIAATSTNAISVQTYTISNIDTQPVISVDLNSDGHIDLYVAPIGGILTIDQLLVNLTTAVLNSSTTDKIKSQILNKIASVQKKIAREMPQQANNQVSIINAITNITQTISKNGGKSQISDSDVQSILTLLDQIQAELN